MSHVIWIEGIIICVYFYWKDETKESFAKFVFQRDGARKELPVVDDCVPSADDQFTVIYRGLVQYKNNLVNLFKYGIVLQHEPCFVVKTKNGGALQQQHAIH